MAEQSAEVLATVEDRLRWWHIYFRLNYALHFTLVAAAIVLPMLAQALPADMAAARIMTISAAVAAAIIGLVDLRRLGDRQLEAWRTLRAAALSYKAGIAPVKDLIDELTATDRSIGNSKGLEAQPPDGSDNQKELRPRQPRD